MENPKDNSWKFRQCAELITYLFTPHTFHRSMEERKPVGYKTREDNTYPQTEHKKRIMESTYSWYQVGNNKPPYTLQQLKYSLQRCPGFMQPCPMLHLTINIQTQICDCSVRSNCSQVVSLIISHFCNDKKALFLLLNTVSVTCLCKSLLNC
jgi:hypothetical protein